MMQSSDERMENVRNDSHLFLMMMTFVIVL